MSTPQRFPLNGYDVLMLRMDGALKARGTNGNICHLLLRFPDGTDVTALAAHVCAGETYRFLSRLRSRTPLLRTPHWRVVDEFHTAAPTAVSAVSTIEQLESWILQHSLDPRHESPLGIIALPQLKVEPGLLLFWHHTLCDAKGGEALAAILGTDGTIPPEQFFPLTTPPALSTLLSQARRTTSHIFSKLTAPLARLPLTSARGTTPPCPTYRKLSFSEEEARSIEALSRELTQGIFPMALHLAASIRAAEEIFAPHSNSPSALCITVPHDMRRNLRSKAPLSNQISSLFFRVALPLGDSMAATTNDLIAQLHDALAHDHHYGARAFFELIRWLPHPLFWHLVERPGRGHPASMYFSDIGASLSGLSSFLDAQVSYASHYPPNLSPPGFTVVWSRYRERLEVTLCYDSTSISVQRLHSFEARLRAELRI